MIVWYIVFDANLGQHVITNRPPAAGVLVQESVFPIGYPAAMAIQSLAATIQMVAQTEISTRPFMAFKLTLNVA